jgi:cellulose synthase/poly-beta-1,6-N-acetylglucosamine synthase-like glycosyltransferase
VKTTFYILLIALTISITSCDAYYSITLTNNSIDTISVTLGQNFRFSTTKVPFQKLDGNTYTYKLNPNEIFKTGSAIAEIDDDIPFDNIIIVSHNDTIRANNIDEIKNLFDKKGIGGLKTPYNLTIK